MGSEQLELQLVDEYSLKLETSLILALLSDYDLSDTSQLRAAKETLAQLQNNATIEEESGFDAGGYSGLRPSSPFDESSRGDENESWKSLRDRSSSTEETEVSQPPSLVGTEREEMTVEDSAYGFQFVALDNTTKEQVLIDMFPNVRVFDITWTLRKAQWDTNVAIDALMTQNFLEEAGISTRGIEAFSRGDFTMQKSKRRGRKKKYQIPATSSTSAESVASTMVKRSQWDKGKEDVDFIATRSGKPVKEVTFLYHKNGASVHATLVSLLEAPTESVIEYDGPVIGKNILELGHEFPTLEKHLVKPLIQMTYPSTSNAHELAAALIARPSSAHSGIQIELRPPPLNIDPTSQDASQTWTGISGLTLANTEELAAQYAAQRQENFTKAGAAYRKSKSDHLKGGAAAYYADLGRRADVRLKTLQSAAADARATTQSSKDEVDLHGINVLDGKRIAMERVVSWWNAFRESKVHGIGGVASEYRIVTGVGYHSEGGRSKLMPAILKMLLKDGWKVQVGTGVLTVTGIATT